MAQDFILFELQELLLMLNVLFSLKTSVFKLNHPMFTKKANSFCFYIRYVLNLRLMSILRTLQLMQTLFSFDSVFSAFNMGDVIAMAALYKIDIIIITNSLDLQI